jgi:hypothetical protein
MMKTSAQLIAAAKKKPLTAEKLTEALEKVRKGATASFTFVKILTVLDALGWEMKPTSAWIPMHWQDRDGRWVLSHAEVYKQEEFPLLEKTRAKMSEEAVHHLPEKVVIGGRVVMDVGLIHGDNRFKHFSFKEWIGAEGMLLTTPRGDVIELLPGKFDVGKPLEGSLKYICENEIKKAGWKEDAAAALGKEVHVPAEARTRENTGTCPVCTGNYKLSMPEASNPVLVLHGYRRPGWGHVSGECDAVGWQPLETSVTGAEKWLKKLEDALRVEKDKLQKLETNQVTELQDRKGHWHKVGDHMFPSLYQNFESGVRSNVKLYGRDVETYRKLIAVWKPRPLPKEGEPQRGLGFFLKA